MLHSIQKDISNSPTITWATHAGTILGTAAYMSPEQAKGKAVDRRADIWAFGCVLYQMLSGKKAFDGETMTDVLAAVVMKEPDLAPPPGQHAIGNSPPASPLLAERYEAAPASHRRRAHRH